MNYQSQTMEHLKRIAECSVSEYKPMASEIMKMHKEKHLPVLTCKYALIIAKGKFETSCFLSEYGYLPTASMYFLNDEAHVLWTTLDGKIMESIETSDGRWSEPKEFVK